MKYINLIYSNSKIGENAGHMVSHYVSTITHHITDENIKFLNKTGIKVFTYLLYSNDTVKKWINNFVLTQKALNKEYGRKEWYYNCYTNPSWDLIHESRKKMNSIIDYINQKKWFKVPENLKLEVNNTKIVEKNKLNELHFIFEGESFNFSNHKDKEEIFYYLEAINNLVHLCEKYISERDLKKEFHSYRLAPDLNKVLMLDSDYEKMEPEEFGKVYIDFGTVGKDLGHCFFTGDIELVKRKEIKQQAYIRPFLSFDWSEQGRDENGKLYPRYYEWCEKNRVRDYGYNYKEPKYNLGRVPLGELINKEILKTGHVQKILAEYPYFVDILLTDKPYQ